MFIELTGTFKDSRQRLLFNTCEIQLLSPDTMFGSTGTTVFYTPNEDAICVTEPYEQVRDTILSMERDRERRQLAAMFMARADNLHILNESQLASLVERSFKAADLIMKGGA